MDQFVFTTWKHISNLIMSLELARVFKMYPTILGLNLWHMDVLPIALTLDWLVPCTGTVHPTGDTDINHIGSTVCIHKLCYNYTSQIFGAVYLHVCGVMYKCGGLKRIFYSIQFLCTLCGSMECCHPSEREFLFSKSHLLSDMAYLSHGYMESSHDIVYKVSQWPMWFLASANGALGKGCCLSSERMLPWGTLSVCW